MTENEATAIETSKSNEEELLSQSFWSLVWWKFKKNRLAMAGGIIVVTLYLVCFFFAEFFAPYLLEGETTYLEARPQVIRFKDSEGNFHLRPFVYGLEEEMDMVLRKRFYHENPEVMYPIHFFVKGDTYKWFGLISTNIHLFGTDPDDPEAHVYIFGTDRLGRDILSRIIYGGRLSLWIGLLGQILTMFLGVTLGTISGYYGGTVDIVIQRLAEFVAAFPDIPLFIALATAIPITWAPQSVYFMLTLILVFIRWNGLARQVRGLILSLREREYVLAALSSGASDARIMFKHLIPGTLSHVIVIATLMIPGMILAETALSWLGLGLRPPLTSWGVLLQEVSNVRAIRFAPWLLIPVPFVILTILAFNMLGDGLRDAMDPYGGQ
jgi:peptide/nickel transport system permease protein